LRSMNAGGDDGPPRAPTIRRAAALRAGGEWRRATPRQAGSSPQPFRASQARISAPVARLDAVGRAGAPSVSAVVPGEPPAGHGDDAAARVLASSSPKWLLERDARAGRGTRGGRVAADAHDDEVVAHDQRRSGDRQHHLLRKDLLHLGAHQRPDAPLGDELVDAGPVGLAGPGERGRRGRRWSPRRRSGSASCTAASMAASPPPTTSTLHPSYWSGSTKPVRDLGQLPLPGHPASGGVPRRPVARTTLRGLDGALLGDDAETLRRCLRVESTVTPSSMAHPRLAQGALPHRKAAPPC